MRFFDNSHYELEEESRSVTLNDAGYDKAEELLSKALEISPNGIDANYFYAQFKEEQKDYKAAREYYLAAQAADPRPGREVADAGRQAEISAALAGLKH